VAVKRDLHKIHRPMTEVFPSCTDPARWRLTDSQVHQFHDQGFVAPIPVLDAGQVEQLRGRLETIRENVGSLQGDLYEVEAAWSEHPEDVVFHFLGAWMVDELFHDLLWHPGVVVPSAQLLGTEGLRFWHDQVFYKPARHPGVVPWHQDYSYWSRTGPPAHITVHLVLDDAGPENGCVHYVPGSHRWPLLPPAPFDGPMDSVIEALEPAHRAAFRPVPVPLRAGEASIHHSHAVHGSFANESDRPRRATVVNSMAPQTRVVDASQPLLKGVPLLGEGDRVEGDHFPLLL